MGHFKLFGTVLLYFFIPNIESAWGGFVLFGMSVWDNSEPLYDCVLLW